MINLIIFMKSKEFYKRFTLELSLTNGLGPVRFKKLLEKFQTIENLYKNRKVIKNIDYKSKIDNLINLDKIDVNSYICLWEEEYAYNLKQIPDPPIVLFYRGVKNLLSNKFNISIVGSRRMSSYGNKVVHNLVRSLKGSSFSVVSGMANGIDSSAHRASLENNIPTIAILASSVDNPTPYNNTNLYDEILANGGLILSETFPGVGINEGFFPRRNRIIAGISLGTIIVEAGEKSGALITARMAQSYSKDVFAVPSSIDNFYSYGSNALIKDNKAKLIQNIDDVLNELSIHFDIEDYNYTRALSEFENEIYNTLESEPRLPEDIADCLKKDISVIISSCSIMELNGFIFKNERGQYCVS